MSKQDELRTKLLCNAKAGVYCCNHLSDDKLNGICNRIPVDIDSVLRVVFDTLWIKLQINGFDLPLTDDDYSAIEDALTIRFVNGEYA